MVMVGDSDKPGSPPGPRGSRDAGREVFQQATFEPD